MTRELRLHVAGVPRPQGSLRLHRAANGHEVARYPSSTIEWRHTVTTAVLAYVGPSFERFTGPVELRLGFEMPRLGSHFGSGRNAGTVKMSAPCWPLVAPDLDKMIRLVGDALTDAGVWRDDACIVSICAAKRYGDHPGVQITVREIEP